MPCSRQPRPLTPPTVCAQIQLSNASEHVLWTDALLGVGCEGEECLTGFSPDTTELDCPPLKQDKTRHGKGVGEDKNRIPTSGADHNHFVHLYSLGTRLQSIGHSFVVVSMNECVNIVSEIENRQRYLLFHTRQPVSGSKPRRGLQMIPTYHLE
jgi:hypothetical protein